MQQGYLPTETVRICCKFRRQQPLLRIFRPPDHSFSKSYSRMRWSHLVVKWRHSSHLAQGMPWTKVGQCAVHIHYSPAIQRTSHFGYSVKVRSTNYREWFVFRNCAGFMLRLWSDLYFGFILLSAWIKVSNSLFLTNKIFSIVYIWILK